MKAFVAQFAQSLDIGPNRVQIAVVTFANKAQQEFNLNTSNNQISLIDAINHIGYNGGGTNTDQALQFVATNSFTPQAGGRSGAAKVLVVLTDGQSSNHGQTIQAANTIHHMNVKVFAIGIGHGVNRAELDGISSDSRHLFQVQDFNALSTLETE